MLPYRRHKRGGGKLVKEEVFVSRNSFINRGSVIVGDCSIFKSEIYDSYIQNSIISEGRLYQVHLNKVTIDGPAHLIGPWKLDGPYYITEGTWTRPPRAMTIQDDSGIYVGLTESVANYAFIACECRSLDSWLKDGLRIGKRLQWAEELRLRAFDFMQELKGCPMAIDERMEVAA